LFIHCCFWNSVGYTTLNGAPDYNVGEGALDVANAETISGWAWYKTRPAIPIDVQLYDGEVPLAVVRADLFRQDLVDTGKGDGRHGFHFSCPDHLRDGRPHIIRAIIVGKKPEMARELEGSPAPIGENQAPE
jgi:hypothetical protein